MHIALLGGSFDPPHVGHLFIAQQVKEQLNVDQVWLMPLYGNFAHHKIFQKNLSPVEDRLAMTKLLENDYIKVSDFEITHNKESKTIVTLEALAKEYPQHTFSWITGSDKLETFQKYERWQDLVRDHHIIVFPREHTLWHLEDRVKASFQLDAIPDNIIVMNNKDLILTNISSTMIRYRIANGLPIKYLVPDSVMEYIAKKRLYE
jgi:nicotinate-nucleotide adenylyltransferase